MKEHETHAHNVAPPCTYLEWDSAFWGYRVADVTHHTLTETSLDEVFTWCNENNIDLLYFLAESNDALTVQLAEANHFQLLDIRLTLMYRFPAVFESTLDGVRPVEAKDIGALQTIAKNSYYDSRFYYDPRLSERRVDALYETWITKSCDSFADYVLVADVNGKPGGYITCHDNGQVGTIGLVGVGAEARGQGVGRQLVQGALTWFYQRNIREVEVVTQGRNIAAQRLYQRAGFITKSVRLWYHRWFVDTM